MAKYLTDLMHVKWDAEDAIDGADELQGEPDEMLEAIRERANRRIQAAERYVEACRANDASLVPEIEAFLAEAGA